MLRVPHSVTRSNPKCATQTAMLSRIRDHWLTDNGILLVNMFGYVRPNVVCARVGKNERVSMTLRDLV